MRAVSLKIRLAFLSASFVLTATLTGCSIINPSVSDESVAELPTDQNQATGDFVIVVKKTKGKKAVGTKIPHDPSMVVDDVLEKSGAKNWFRRCSVKIVRNSERGQVPLDIEYNNSQDRVEPLYDYAVHHGDRIIVQEDPRTSLDDMLQTLNPLD